MTLRPTINHLFEKYIKHSPKNFTNEDLFIKVWKECGNEIGSVDAVKFITELAKASNCSYHSAWRRFDILEQAGRIRSVGNRFQLVGGFYI